MNTTRFITADEIDYLRVTYAVGRKNTGTVLTEEHQERIVGGIKRKMQEGTMKVAMVFDEGNNPIASYQAFEVPQLLAWRWCGISSVLPYNHFNKSAPILAPALDLMMNYMESKGYYKFWAINTETNLNIRFRIMRRYSTLLYRYNCYDELIIPKGQMSGVPLFDMLRMPIAKSNAVVRLFTLDQKHRIDLFRKHGYDDYKGTIIDEN